ncbi:MAG: hypothetical protein KBF74_03590 [Ferruginibacter sp.]|nr:hypothetical protein [Ferruginibacter sp.]
MNKLFITVSLGFVLLSCNGHSAAENKSDAEKMKAADMIDGKDYITLKRFRLTDRSGFNQPVEASSFLLPADWQVSGDVQWDGIKKCIPEMVQASLHASSPDGEYELMMFPVTQFDWSDDPVYLDAMRRGFNRQSCVIAQPLDAAGYISNYLAPYLKATVKSAGIIEALQQQMDESANQMTSHARQAGNNAYSHRGSAAEGLLSFNDGKEGLAFCTVMQTIVTMPGTQGGMISNYYSYMSLRLVLKYSKGNETAARKIMSTFFSSVRINPVWSQAIERFFYVVGKGAQDEGWKQIQITQQAQQEIGNNILRSWEAGNKNSNTGDALNNSSQFSQYLRGVDSWRDEQGNTVELTSGYSNAWSKVDGTYILSNNPAFDPNVTFNEDWKRLNQ